MNLIEMQFSTTTVDDERNYFTGERSPLYDNEPSRTIVPAGVYRVIDGEVFKVVTGRSSIIPGRQETVSNPLKGKWERAYGTRYEHFWPVGSWEPPTKHCLERAIALCGYRGYPYEADMRLPNTTRCPKCDRKLTKFEAEM